MKMYYIVLFGRIAGESLMLSVGDWLENIGLGQYEYTLVANGFDNTDFLVSIILAIAQQLNQV